MWKDRVFVDNFACGKVLKKWKELKLPTNLGINWLTDCKYLGKLSTQTVENNALFPFN
ncbi:hypothetical protein X279_09260 [Oenococcus oeni IOEB_0501]|nr:hypothetical protein X279_09260 [Oenococcus oeni IOEB_0501]